MIDTVVVGLGRIGSVNMTVDGPPLNHVAAVRSTSGLRLIGLVDPDAAARKGVVARWPDLTGVPAVETIAQLPGKADVVVLSTPSKGRLAQVTDSLRLQPKVLLVEKPLAEDAAAATEIVSMANAAGVALRINFHRRFDPGYRRLKAQLNGTPRKAVLRYGRGLLNYAIHHIDFLLDWFGPISAVQAIGEIDEDDANVSFLCVMEAGFEVFIIGMHGTTYDQFECDLFFTDERIELSNGGVEKRIYQAAAGLYYPNYTHLHEQVSAGESSLVGGLAETYQAIESYINTDAPLGGCTGEDAITGLRVIEAVLHSFECGGRLVQPLIPQMGDLAAVTRGAA